jgi:TIR domain
LKVFISWSGAQSRAIAQALREWLPLVIQAVEPWMSDVDIGKGTRWTQEIGMELAQTSFGIICLTADNLDAPWINFEAGAISKTLDGARVCTYLYNLKPTDVDGPLSQFNHTRVDRDETRRLLHAINQALGTHSLRDQVVDRLFDALWQQFEEKLKNLPPPESSQRPDRPMGDMIEELLELVRSRLRPHPVDESAIEFLFDGIQAKILRLREIMDKIEQSCVTLDKGGSIPVKLSELIDSAKVLVTNLRKGIANTPGSPYLDDLRQLRTRLSKLEARYGVLLAEKAGAIHSEIQE